MTIKVFVGSETKTKVAFLVLKHSILSRTDSDVEVVEMGDFDPWLVPSPVHQGTGFSLRRWMIPEQCGFKGAAIYLDADQLVFGDIKELWDYKEIGRTIACCFRPDKCSELITGRAGSPVPQTSVMVINCDLCDPKEWSSKEIFNKIMAAGPPHSKGAVKTYQRIMHGHLVTDDPWPLELRWNEFNTLHKNTKLLHYTFETQQPWYQPWHPLSSLWEAELVRAIVAGVVSESHLEEAIDLGRRGSGDWRRYGGMHEHYNKYVELARGV